MMHRRGPVDPSEAMAFVAPMFAFFFLGMLVFIALQWLYFAGMESSERQGTIGKSVLSLRVTTPYEGQRMSFGHATGRFFCKNCQWDGPFRHRVHYGGFHGAEAGAARFGCGYARAAKVTSSTATLGCAVLSSCTAAKFDQDIPHFPFAPCQKFFGPEKSKAQYGGHGRRTESHRENWARIQLSRKPHSQEWLCYGSNPNTATLFDVAAKTLPSAIIGVTYLFPLPKWSRPLAAWLLL